jgi:hypothetical protein
MYLYIEREIIYSYASVHGIAFQQMMDTQDSDPMSLYHLVMLQPLLFV